MRKELFRILPKLDTSYIVPPSRKYLLSSSGLFILGCKHFERVLSAFEPMDIVQSRSGRLRVVSEEKWEKPGYLKRMPIDIQDALENLLGWDDKRVIECQKVERDIWADFDTRYPFEFEPGIRVLVEDKRHAFINYYLYLWCWFQDKNCVPLITRKKTIDDSEYVVGDSGDTVIQGKTFIIKGSDGYILAVGRLLCRTYFTFKR